MSEPDAAPDARAVAGGHADLDDDLDDELATAIAEVRQWVDAAQQIVVLTGAGISTDSGIPDFRGPQGVWTRDPEAEKRATLQNYMTDPALRRRAWRDRLEHTAFRAEPNAGHRALVQLERRHKLDTLVTQNIDGLHQAAGSDPARVVEVHGTVHEVMCMTCDERAPMQRALDRVRAGDEDPSCRTCGGILKSATVSFGQNLFPGDIERAAAAAQRADLMLAIGSTLAVYPVADIVPVARAAGARVVIVNGSETAMDGLAHAVLRGPIGRIVPAIVAAPPRREGS